MSDVYTSPYIRYNAAAVRGPYVVNPISLANMQPPAGMTGPGTGAPNPTPNPNTPAIEDPPLPPLSSGGGGGSTPPPTDPQKPRRSLSWGTMPAPTGGTPNPRISVPGPSPFGAGPIGGTPNPRISVPGPSPFGSGPIGGTPNPRIALRFADGGAVAPAPVPQVTPPPMTTGWRPPSGSQITSPMPLVPPGRGRPMPLPPPSNGAPPPFLNGNIGMAPRMRGPGQMLMPGNRDGLDRMGGNGNNGGLGFMGGRPPGFR